MTAAPDRSGSRPPALGLCVLLVLGLCLGSVAIGTRIVGWTDIAAALAGGRDSIAQAAVAARIPRTVLGLLAGAALGPAGALLQGVTRNPLADPGILGINMGAALAVVIGAAWFSISTASSYIWSAILGAGLAAVFVHGIASLGRGGATPLKLALAGAASSVAFSSLVIAIVLPRNDIAGGIQAWQIGGIGGATLPRILPVLPVLAAVLLCGATTAVAYTLSRAPAWDLQLTLRWLSGSVNGAQLPQTLPLALPLAVALALAGGVLLARARDLEALRMGEDTAAALGVRVGAARALVILCATGMIAVATAVTGPISFVAFLSGPIAARIVGAGGSLLLPSALVGAALVLAADYCGQFLLPGRYPVGVVTGALGAPYLIHLIIRVNRSGGSL